MIIEKIINNNVISSRDESGQEVVVMGSGLAFGMKKGQEIVPEKIEKVFYMEDEETLGRFKNLLQNLPLEYLQVSDDIISYARENLEMELNQSVYITLTDHINFAIERFKQDMLLENGLYHEVRRFYPIEFSIGQRALHIIYEKTGYKLPEDEAASIALHLFNAEFDLKVRETWGMTNVLKEFMDELQEKVFFVKGESLEKDRMISDLKFLVHRMLFQKPEKETADAIVTTFVKENLLKEFEIVKMLSTKIQEKFRCSMTEEEMVYFSFQIKRMEDLQK